MRCDHGGAPRPFCPPLQETMNPARVRQYLSNPKEQEKAKGMKWLLAMIS